MNLPNKLTMMRIYLSFIIIVILLFPFDATGFAFPKLFINASLVVDARYLIAGVLFIIAALTDFLDGYVARKYHMVTDLGKMLDAIADKVLVNSVLIILSAQGFIHPIITVIIITRDSITNAIKMVAGNKGKVVAASKLGKYKTACMMVGITLTLFYNLPFELWNLKVSDFLLIIAAVLSIASGVQYYQVNKHLLTQTNKEPEIEIVKGS